MAIISILLPNLGSVGVSLFLANAYRMLLGAAVLVFLSALGVDYAHARYTKAVARGDRHRAAGWSVVTSLVGTVCLLAAVDVSLWLVGPELAGLYIGSLLALR